MKKRIYSKLTGLFLIVALAGLFGCQSVSSFFVGETVEPELGVPLTAGVLQKGTWKTFDVVISYSAEMGADRLDIYGHAGLGEHHRMMYDSLKHLDVYLFFLNNDSAVLETVLLATNLSSSIDQQVEFMKILPLPPGTRAISFGYRGATTSLDGNASFDELP
jgi:hypothetical protein